MTQYDINKPKTFASQRHRTTILHSADRSAFLSTFRLQTSMNNLPCAMTSHKLSSESYECRAQLSETWNKSTLCVEACMRSILQHLRETRRASGRVQLWWQWKTSHWRSGLDYTIIFLNTTSILVLVVIAANGLAMTTSILYFLYLKIWTCWHSTIPSLFRNIRFPRARLVHLKNLLSMT